VKHRIAKLFGSIAVVGLGIMSAGLVAQSATADTLPAANCVTACTATFDTPGDGTFTIPAGISTLTATIAGAAGAPASFAITNDPTGVGGNGGAAALELGSSYAGSTLTFGVGATGNGSYLQGKNDRLLAVAGGGGGGGYAAYFQWPDQILAVYPGGDGGAPATAGITPGNNGQAFGNHVANGRGGTELDDEGVGGIGGLAPSASNGTPGQPGRSITAINSGAVTLASGGAGGSFFAASHVGGAGGSGYSGGGGGAVQRFVPNGDVDVDVVAPGGGGSAYLDAAVSAIAQSPNARGGYVSFTWAYSPRIKNSLPGTTPGVAPIVKRGNTVPVSIDGLPANVEYTVVFDGAVVASGVTGATRTAQTSFVIPLTQGAGTYSFSLLLGTTAVAVSQPIVVDVPTTTDPTDPVDPIDPR
jgi:hypothetical protein